MRVVALLRELFTFQPVAAHPCPGDPGFGNDPAPPPRLDPLPDPADVCAGLAAATIPRLPDIAVRVNPILGLVNLESWFWAEGYDGRDFTASQSFSSPPYEDDMTVDLIITPVRYQWSFGDGATFESAGRSGLGQDATRGQQPSTVAHTYKAPNKAAGYPITLTVEWRVRCGAIVLAPVVRTFEGIHRVQETDPVLR